MRKTFLTFAALLAIALAPPALAQEDSAALVLRVEPEVQPAQAASKAAPAKRRPRASRATRVELPAPRDEELAGLLQQRKGAPLAIGRQRPVIEMQGEEGTHGKLAWETLEDGAQVAAVAVRSPGAAALRVALHVNQVPPDAAFRFHEPASDEAIEFSGEDLLDTIAANLEAGETGREARLFWSPVIEGDTVEIEIELPPGARTQGLRIAVPEVSHLVGSPRQDLQAKAVAACHNDASCYTSTWGSQIDSVARMVFTSGGYSYVCTGTLLADSDPATLVPYFLTANHCIDSQTAASSLQTWWFLRASSCNSGVAGPYATRSGGATLLYNSTATDVSFLRLGSAPPAGATYAGWLVGSPPGSGTDVTGLHHPNGDLLRASFGDVQAYATCTAPTNGQFSCNYASLSGSTFYEIGWRSGITQPGSSGSGLFVDNGRYLVGQLYGGSSSCSDPKAGDLYGRFDVSYNAALKKWLAPATTPTSPQQLTVAGTGTGTGAVASSPAGISCGTTCAASFPYGASVALTATPQPLSTFAGWSGACAGTGACSVSMSAARSVTATFNYAGASWPPAGALPAGYVSGDAGWQVVSGSPDYDTYEGTTGLKSKSVPGGGAATLTYSAQFAGGAVTFARRVSSAPGGGYLRFYVDGRLDAEWTGNVAWGMHSVTLASGAHTLAWKYEKPGAAGGLDAAWIDAINLPASSLPSFRVSVTRTGVASGTVTSAPAGIDCGSACAQAFVSGSRVSLAAKAARDARLASWSGACGGGGACAIDVTGDAAVTARFEPVGGRSRRKVLGR